MNREPMDRNIAIYKISELVRTATINAMMKEKARVTWKQL